MGRRRAGACSRHLRARCLAGGARIATSSRFLPLLLAMTYKFCSHCETSAAALVVAIRLLVPGTQHYRQDKGLRIAAVVFSHSLAMTPNTARIAVVAVSCKFAQPRRGDSALH